MSLLTVWHATFVRRWHKSHDFYDTGDMQHGHAGRMAVMAQYLWPDDLTLCAACILHDMGEGGGGPGDICGLAKAKSPALRQAANDMEMENILALGLPQYHDDPRVHLLDRLDAYLWAIHHKPWKRDTPEWCEAYAEIDAMIRNGHRFAGVKIRSAMRGVGI